MMRATKLLFCTTMLIWSLGHSAALAQEGYVGLSLGSTSVYEEDLDQTESSAFASLDGFYSWQLGTGSLGVEFSFGQDGSGLDPLSTVADGDLRSRYFAALHYAMPLGERATASGFIGYGRAPHGGGIQDYALVYGGIGGSYLVNDALLIYGQIGLGDAPNHGTSRSSGFYKGSFARLGIDYAISEMTDITFEIETAESDEYEDPGEPGKFSSLYLGGATVLGQSNWEITYGLRRASYDAINDSNAAEETTVMIGLRMNIGGTRSRDMKRHGFIGSPHLPMRATDMTTLMQ